MYVEYVWGLMFYIMCIYVDYVFQVEFGIDCCCCNFVLIGISFCDDVSFVYVMCQNDLFQYVVDFMCIGVVQFVVFKVNFGFVKFFGYVWCEIEWVWVVNVMCLEVIYFGLE